MLLDVLGRLFRFSCHVFPLAALCASSTARSAPLDLPVERYRLANGLRVILAPDLALGDATVIVQYQVGTADDPDRLEGLAHLTEHLQFSGSKHVAPGDHFRLLEAVGASSFVGQTTRDSTTYGETVPPEAIDLALWLESDRMGFAADRMDEARVAHERTIVFHEYESRVVDSILGPAKEFLDNELFPAGTHIIARSIGSVSRQRFICPTSRHFFALGIRLPTQH